METKDYNASFGLSNIGQVDTIDIEEAPGTLDMDIPMKDMHISESFSCISTKTAVKLKLLKSITLSKVTAEGGFFSPRIFILHFGNTSVSNPNLMT